jgi:hypothetical protein
VPGAAEQTATIHLGPALPQTSVRPTRDLIGGPPASLSGLAPGGVCRAAPVARDAGGLLLHRFTLACSRTRRFEEIRLSEPPAGFRRSLPSSAVCSLLHFPSGHPAWALPSTLPCGVRTFLCVQRSPGGLTPQCYLQLEPAHCGRCASAGRTPAAPSHPIRRPSVPGASPPDDSSCPAEDDPDRCQKKHLRGGGRAAPET